MGNRVGRWISVAAFGVVCGWLLVAAAHWYARAEGVGPPLERDLEVFVDAGALDAVEHRRTPEVVDGGLLDGDVDDVEEDDELLGKTRLADEGATAGQPSGEVQAEVALVEHDDQRVNGRAASVDEREEDTSVERFGSERLVVWSLSGRRHASYPRALGEIGTELEYNAYFAMTTPESERDNWLTNVHLEQTFALSRNTSIDTNVRVVLNSDGEDRRFYSDFPHEGIYLIRFLAVHAREHFAAFAGKYEPAAGIRGQGPIFFGNYSRDLALDGRVGGGASLVVGDKSTGKHTLTGHWFRIDRSRLRGEILSDQWREDALMAQAGPIGLPKSVLFTVHGTTVERQPAFAYTLGGGVQDRGLLPSERILFAALFGAIPIDGVGDLELSVDAMHLHGAGGYAENKRVLGPSAALSLADMSIGASYTLRRVYDRDEQVARLDHIVELVGRYAISQRTTAEAAYQHILERGQHSNAVGVVVRYAADWLIH